MSDIANESFEIEQRLDWDGLVEFTKTLRSGVVSQLGIPDSSLNISTDDGDRIVLIDYPVNVTTVYDAESGRVTIEIE